VQRSPGPRATSRPPRPSCPLRATAVPGEAAACHRARADLLLSSGRPGPAARAYESCLASESIGPRIALAGLRRGPHGRGRVFPGALAAVRRAADVAAADGRASDRQRVLERGARIASTAGDPGDDAASVLESLALLLVGEGPASDPAAIELVSRAAAAL